MLNELHISQLGVVEQAHVEFSGGFSVVTGETGAGKTMVVSSLRLLSGQRADASKVRHGADRASVEGIFTTSVGKSGNDAEVVDIVEEAGGEAEELPGGAHEVIISRSVLASGRSRAHIAGKTVPASVIAECGAQMITIHGQNDQLRLLDPVRQLRAVDKFAGTWRLAQEFSQMRKHWRALSQDLTHRLEKRRELALEAETLRRAVEEITDIDPQPGEDEQLKSDIRALQRADDMRTGIIQVLVALDGAGEDDVESAQDLLIQAQRGLDSLSSLIEDATFSTLAQTVESLSVELSAVTDELNRSLQRIPDPDSLDDLLERQRELKTLRKYAVDVDEVLAWRDDAIERLEKIDVSDDVIDALRSQVHEEEQKLLACGAELTAARQGAAEEFSRAVSNEIKGLYMAARLEVKISTVHSVQESYDTGMDTVEFLLVQGGHPQPLASSASGGELSRVMLALEVILAAEGRTLVFDEVDAGVGGKAAMEIGRRLARLAQKNQVIVVTHLPQVAAFADTHLYVSKAASEESVTSSVVSLGEEERVDELARMLAGLESDSGRAHAEELRAIAVSQI